MIISPVLMAVVGAPYARAVYANEGLPVDPCAGKACTALVRGIIAFGVFISVAKLRENPHVSAGRAPLVVNVSGGQWWWEIDTYEIAMGQEAESCVKTEDVTHGMDIYAPAMTLVAQAQAMPGYTSKLAHTSDKPGTYQFLCMEFCGIAHHDMVNEFDLLEASQWLMQHSKLKRARKKTHTLL